MSMNHFDAYANESDVISLANLTIENRLDRISLYGDIDLTADQRGLALARQLQSLLERVVAALEARNLPEILPTSAVNTVKNPFDEG